MLKCDVGGPLDSFLHLYHYKSFDERDAIRARAAETAEWSSEYLPKAKSMMRGQENAVYLPAAQVLEAAGSEPIQTLLSKSSQNKQPSMIELRQYQLHPGYDNIPTLLRAFEKG